MNNFCKVGFIEMFGGLHAPMGYVLCNGQALDKVKYANLYSVIGDVYTPPTHSNNHTFCVPNYQGRSPLGMSNNYPLGTEGGEKEVTLKVSEIPSHTHAVNAVLAPGTSTDPTGRLLSNTAGLDREYSDDAADTTMDGGMVANSGGGESHNNMHPYLSINFVIYTGI